jgi:hypothetical protein
MKSRLGLVLLGQLVAAPALADRYPFSGFYALEKADAPHAGCAFDVLHQSESGAFSGYLFDKPHWDKKNEARFLRYKQGTCTFDSKTGIDRCVTHAHSINDVSSAKPDSAKVTVINADAVAMLTLGEDDHAAALPDLPPFLFRRCPYEAAQIAPRLLDHAAGYTKSELTDMARVRDPKLVQDVLEAITLTRAK